MTTLHSISLLVTLICLVLFLLRTDESAKTQAVVVHYLCTISATLLAYLLLGPLAGYHVSDLATKVSGLTITATLFLISAWFSGTAGIVPFTAKVFYIICAVEAFRTFVG